MDKQSTTDISQKYQDILDRYSKDISSNVTVEVGTPRPIFESLSSSVPVKKNVFFFRSLFFISLFIFLVVLGGIIYTVFFTNNSIKEFSENNSDKPIVTITDGGRTCEVNEKKYQVNESFPSDDGCNTCTCGEDLTIACTLMACDSTPESESSVPPQQDGTQQ